MWIIDAASSMWVVSLSGRLRVEVSSSVLDTSKAPGASVVMCSESPPPMGNF